MAGRTDCQPLAAAAQDGAAASPRFDTEREATVARSKF
jgi:hypothetical protein